MKSSGLATLINNIIHSLTCYIYREIAGETLVSHFIDSKT